MDLETRITGVEDIEKVFNELPRALQRKAYYRALMAGGGVVQRAAVLNIKSTFLSDEATGTLAKNIRVNRLKKYRGNYRVAVRVRKGAVNKKKKDKDGNPVRVGLYGSVLEYGKKNQPPRSWLRKALRSEQASSVQAITDGMRKNMLQALNDAKDKAGVSGRRYKI